MTDGSVISGDVQSVDWQSVVIIVNQQPKTVPRNQVKRITLVPRLAPAFSPSLVELQLSFESKTLLKRAGAVAPQHGAIPA